MFFSYLETEKGLKDNLIFKGSHKLLGHRRNKEITESVMLYLIIRSIN